MRVLRVRPFRLLLAGEAVNAVGNWVAIVAIWGFAAFRFDADAGDLATLFVILSVPGTLLGPALGVVIDRVGPRRSLLWANAAGACSALALTGADSYRDVILLALPLGLVEAVASASLDALPPRLVPDEDLVPANALLDGARNLAIVIGPVVAAVTNAQWGLTGAFLFDAATFAIGFAVVWPLRVGPVTPAGPAEVAEAGHTSAFSELRGGLRLVRRSKGLRWTLGAATITYAMWAFFGVLEPLYVREVLGASETTFALLQTVFGVGLVGSGLVIARVGDRVATPRTMALAIVVSGATAALYLGTGSVAVAFAGAFLWGVDVAFFAVPVRTLLQRFTPVEAHGRVLSLNQSLEPATSLVIPPLAALLVTGIGVQSLALAGGLTVALAGLVALRLARGISHPLPGVEDAGRVQGRLDAPVHL